MRGPVMSELLKPLTEQLGSSPLRCGEPLARKTSMRVGGSADAWFDIGSRRDLATIVRWSRERGIAFNLLGAGSNTLVSDLGVRGITARLAGSEFDSIAERKGVLVAGAALHIGDLLRWAEEHSWGGLEFLEGIPGTVGGALHMNAGAWGEEIGNRVAWVRFINDRGEECVDASPAFSYRSGFRNGIIIEAGLAVVPADSHEIRHRRATISERRAWMRGLHCAGSIFMNPSEGFAGALIERAGLKGARIGGAVVNERHANIVMTEDGATASDVIALVEKVRDEIHLRFGTELATEIEVLE